MGISVIYFNIFQYNKAVEQRRIDPVVRTGPKSLLTLSRMALLACFFFVSDRILVVSQPRTHLLNQEPIFEAVRSFAVFVKTRRRKK